MKKIKKEKRYKPQTLWVAKDDNKEIGVYISEPIKMYGIWVCKDYECDVYLPLSECSKPLQFYISKQIKDTNGLLWKPEEIKETQDFIDYDNMISILKTYSNYTWV